MNSDLPDIPGRSAPAVGEVVRFLPDLVRLLWSAGRDPRVPWYAKAAALGSVAYVVSPVDVLPDVIPVVGQLDDAWLVVKAFRFLLREAGHDVLRELWPGDEDGYAALLWIAGIRD